MALAETFLGHLRAKPDAWAALPNLESVLAGMVDAGRRAWPDVPLSDEDFVRYLAARVDAQADPAPTLAATHTADLWLGCGCASGAPAAVAAFEAHFLTQVPGFLTRADQEPTIADEVKQLLRTSLLIGESGVPPRIAGYSGRGPLGGWLRVSATRAALRLRVRQARSTPLDESELELKGGAGDPELAFLKAHHAADLREAFTSTLADLATRERAVLKLHYLEGLATETIAGLYRVSPRTAQRWLAEARQTIVDRTRRRLAERLKLSAAELDSLLGLLQSPQSGGPKGGRRTRS